jgi:hypothetical protein
VQRHSMWRGRGSHVGTGCQAGPAMRSAAPRAMARHRLVRRRGGWRGTLGVAPARAARLLPFPLLPSSQYLLWRWRRILFPPFSNPSSNSKDIVFNLFYKVISFNSLYFHPNECSQTLDPKGFEFVCFIVWLIYVACYWQQF